MKRDVLCHPVRSAIGTCDCRVKLGRGARYRADLHLVWRRVGRLELDHVVEVGAAVVDRIVLGMPEQNP